MVVRLSSMAIIAICTGAQITHSTPAFYTDILAGNVACLVGSSSCPGRTRVQQVANLERCVVQTTAPPLFCLFDTGPEGASAKLQQIQAAAPHPSAAPDEAFQQAMAMGQAFLPSTGAPADGQPARGPPSPNKPPNSSSQVPIHLSHSVRGHVCIEWSELDTSTGPP